MSSKGKKNETATFIINQSTLVWDKHSAFLCDCGEKKNCKNKNNTSFFYSEILVKVVVKTSIRLNKLIG